MKNFLCKNKTGLLGLLYVILSITAMGFYYFIAGTGINSFMLYLTSGSGGWYGLLSFFHILYVTGLICVGSLSMLSILNNLKVVNFSITAKKLNECKLYKILITTLTVLSVLIFINTLIIVTSNGLFGFVFGAGTFLLMTVNLFAMLSVFGVFGLMINKFKNKTTVVRETREIDNNDDTAEEVIVDPDKDKENIEE